MARAGALTAERAADAARKRAERRLFDTGLAPARCLVDYKLLLRYAVDSGYLTAEFVQEFADLDGNNVAHDKPGLRRLLNVLVPIILYEPIHEARMDEEQINAALSALNRPLRPTDEECPVGHLPLADAC